MEEGFCSDPLDSVLSGELEEDLEENGFAVLRNVLSNEECSKLKEAFASLLALAIENPSPNSFSKILNRKNRYDLRLNLDPLIDSAMKNIMANYGHFYSKIFSPRGKLVELGVMTSMPGSERQDIHSDVVFENESARIYTTFVALQDIDDTMGPTWIWPGSHSEYFQTFYKPTMLGPVDIYYWKNPHCKLSVKAGDAIFMDTRVMHCASQNLSSIDRMLFHFSFKTVDYEKDPTGFTYHILPDLKDKITLREFLMEKDIEEEDNEEEDDEEERV